MKLKDVFKVFTAKFWGGVLDATLDATYEGLAQHARAMGMQNPILTPEERLRLSQPETPAAKVQAPPPPGA